MTNNTKDKINMPVRVRETTEAMWMDHRDSYVMSVDMHTLAEDFLSVGQHPKERGMSSNVKAQYHKIGKEIKKVIAMPPPMRA